MANTLIQIRYSTANASPQSLNVAEPGYSYQSNTLYIGTSDGTGVLAIGGYSQFLKLNSAYTQANAAFAAANSANGGTIVDAYNQANAAYVQANLVFGVANAAFAAANSGASSGAAFDKANTANITADFASATASAAYNKANAANVFANSVNITAVFANTTAIAAFDSSNTKFSSSGGSIAGDVSISGNLNVTGTFIAFNTQNYAVNDPLMILANNNISDVVDLGVIGRYQNTSTVNVFTGLFRDSGTKEWYVFDRYTDGFLANTNHIDPSANNFSVAFINANVRSSNIILNGLNLHSYITSAFVAANGANIIANAAFTQANTANVNAANASFMNTGTVDPARITGSYTGITGLGTITTGVWQGTNVAVAYGGTGRVTLANNGILYGNTTGPVNITAAGVEGNVLQVNNNGVPVFGMINGGTF